MLVFTHRDRSVMTMYCVDCFMFDHSTNVTATTAGKQSAVEYVSEPAAMPLIIFNSVVFACYVLEWTFGGTDD